MNVKLTENPFAILGASPLDSRHRLSEKADEAALLNGASVDEALMVLMQMNRRITAELNWFPGAAPKAASAFLAYIKALASGQTAPMPSLDGLRSPLAQANALYAFFEYWPSSRPEYTFGLFRSLNMVLSKVNAAEVLAQINQDRQAGGWEMIPDELALSGPLDDRLREICQLVGDRMEKISSDDSLLKMINRLFADPDFDPLGVVGKAMTDSWMMRIHDREDALRQQITERLNQLKGSPVSAGQLDDLKKSIGRWADLTAPLRKSAGPARRSARTISLDMRQCIVRYFNNAPLEQKRMSKQVPAFGGTRTVVLSYMSKKDAIQKAIDLEKWLAEQFPEQTDALSVMAGDRQQLENILIKEEENARSALEKAK